MKQPKSNDATERGALIASYDGYNKLKCPMTYTDTQLQLALAKMLPEKLRSEYPGVVCWLGQIPEHHAQGLLLVRDTEWLHVCWLVEQTLFQDGTKVKTYFNHLYQLINQECVHATGFEFDDLVSCAEVATYAVHATWQQRAIALCKVKGVESV